MKQNPKKSSFFKIFGGLSLATLITCGTLLAFTPIFSNSTANTNSQNLSAQDQLLNDTLNLAPQNDPVVYNTSTGLEIKYANALSNSNLAGYTYFTMGEYQGIPINWVIIGYDPSLKYKVKDFSGNPFSTLCPIISGNIENTIDSTVAGKAIYSSTLCISKNAVENDEIGSGCVLCICETTLDSTTFTNSSGCNYEGSNLQSITQGYYDSLNFPTYSKKLIVPQTITSAYMSYNNGTTYSINENQYLFSLAQVSVLGTATVYQEQKFQMETYLKSNSARISYAFNSTSTTGWWSRSGYNNSYSSERVWGVYVTSSGVIERSGNTGLKAGIRPVFVMKLA